MDVFSPSHATEQDVDPEIPSNGFDNCAINVEMGFKGFQCYTHSDADMENASLSKMSCLSKSPDLSPSLSNSSNMPLDVLRLVQCSPTFFQTVDTLELNDINNVTKSIEKPNIPALSWNTDRLSDDGQNGKTCTKGSFGRKELNPRTNEKKYERGCYGNRRSSRSYKESNLTSKSSRYRGRSPRRKRYSRSPSDSSPRHSCSHSRNRRRIRSRSNSRHRRRSRSLLRDNNVRRHSKSYKDHRTRSRSCSRQGKTRATKIQDLRKGSSVCVSTVATLNPTASTMPRELPLQNSRLKKVSYEPYDMDRTSTPDIAVNHASSGQIINGNVGFGFRIHPPPSSTKSNFTTWQQSQTPPVFVQRSNLNILEHPPSTLLQGNFQHRPRLLGYNSSIQSRRELPPNLMPQLPNYNPIHSNRFPGVASASFVAINEVPKPVLPFGGLLGQPPPPPPPLPSLPVNFSYTAPPPFLKPSDTTSNVPFQHYLYTEVPPKPTLIPPSSPLSQSNLIETLMSKAGLQIDGLSSQNTVPSGSGTDIVSISAIPFPEPIEEKSSMKKINKMLNSAASTLLTQLNVPVNVINNPPPPMPCQAAEKRDSFLYSAKSTMPPLPNITGSAGGSEYQNVINFAPTDEKKDKRNSVYNVHELLSKRRRSEFSSIREWQERIALEVKSFIKPFYAAGKLSKEDCRTVLKKSVNKISRSRCTSINTKKISEFVKLYLRKYYKYRKWQARQHRLKSGSTAKEPSVQ